MSNIWFRFKQFKVEQDKCAMKIGTDSILLGAWTNCSEAKTVLDIGTGTGVLALMLAQKSDAEIFAIDIDEQSVIQAKQNVNNSPWHNRIHLYNSSLQNFTHSLPSFDIIIINPPFFKNSLKAPDALRTLARHAYTLTHQDILTFCTKNLSQAGKLAIILPLEQGNNFIKLSSQIGLYCIRKCYVKPNPNKEAHRLLLEFSFQKQITQETEIIIETGTRHHYTNENKKLTKEFYLNFKF